MSLAVIFIGCACLLRLMIYNLEITAALGVKGMFQLSNASTLILGGTRRDPSPQTARISKCECMNTV